MNGIMADFGEALLEMWQTDDNRNTVVPTYPTRSQYSNAPHSTKAPIYEIGYASSSTEEARDTIHLDLRKFSRSR